MNLGPVSRSRADYIEVTTFGDPDPRFMHKRTGVICDELGVTFPELSRLRKVDAIVGGAIIKPALHVRMTGEEWRQSRGFWRAVVQLLKELW